MFMNVFRKTLFLLLPVVLFGVMKAQAADPIFVVDSRYVTVEKLEYWSVDALNNPILLSEEVYYNKYYSNFKSVLVIPVRLTIFSPLKCFSISSASRTRLSSSGTGRERKCSGIVRYTRLSKDFLRTKLASCSRFQKFSFASSIDLLERLMPVFSMIAKMIRLAKKGNFIYNILSR